MIKQYKYFKKFIEQYNKADNYKIFTNVDKQASLEI